MPRHHNGHTQKVHAQKRSWLGKCELCGVWHGCVLRSEFKDGSLMIDDF